MKIKFLILLTLIGLVGLTLNKSVFGACQPYAACGAGGHLCCGGCFNGFKSGVFGCVADCQLGGGTCGADINTRVWCNPGSCCSPSCPTACGQPDGCGGTCGTGQVGQTNGNTWCDGQCDSAPPGGTCGSYQKTMTCNNGLVCGGSQQFEAAGPCSGQTGCVECGPSYGGWSACTAPAFTQSRSVTTNCSGNSTQTQACRANITGIMFDATAVADCTTIGTQPKLSGVTVRATSTVNQIGQVFNAVTDASGNYAHANLNVPDTYALSFLNLPSGYDVVPKLSCDGGSTVSLAANGGNVVRRFGFTRVYNPWFQVIGGDIFGNTGIKSDIPSTCSTSANCNNYNVGPTTYTPLIVDGPGGTSSLAYINSGTISNGFPSYTNARTSKTGASASSGYKGRNYDYGYYFAKTAPLNRTNYSGTAKPTGSVNADSTRSEFSSASTNSTFTLPSDYGVYLSSGTLTIDGSWSLGANEKIIILHNGNVNVTGNMAVSNNGSFFGVVASGSITFASNVTSAQGIYIGDTITVSSTGNTATEQKFNGQGTFVGWNGVNLLRNRGGTNATDSSEMFTFRPDLVYYAPDGFKPSKVIWQEVAP